MVSSGHMLSGLQGPICWVPAPSGGLRSSCTLAECPSSAACPLPIRLGGACCVPAAVLDVEDITVNQSTATPALWSPPPGGETQTGKCSPLEQMGALEKN